MIVSYKWLKTLIDFKLSVDDVSDLLTNTGLEVEKVNAVDSVKGGLKNLVIGQIVACEKHPDADRLSVTKVDLGYGEPLNIVCGAPNVAVGQKVVVAPVGSTIHPLDGDSFKIKNAKIRGVESHGMICAEDEIGLGSNHDGIIVLGEDGELGSSAADYFNVESDYQIEIGLTPNRGDATSHLGVARDIKAVTGLDVILPEINEVKASKSAGYKIDIKDSKLCPRYTGILLKNVHVTESPDWLKKRLISIGSKPINNVVDVTNFVLHELGHPIHAFDADKVEGDTIAIRLSKRGEKITTLDEVERELTGDELLIADTHKPLAIAGVFGGKDSGITETTTKVFIESAYFDPGTIRKSAKAQGLNTDASFRYERGCDPEITVRALHRVVDLLNQTAGAEPASSISDEYPNPLLPAQITLNLLWLNKFCGTEMDAEEVITILKRLDFQVSNTSSNNLKLIAPLYRSDVQRPVDVAEEVLRIYGYNRVEIPSRVAFTPAISEDKNMFNLQARISQILSGLGFFEIMNNSQTRVVDASDRAVKILNPLSAELAVMRTDMLPGMLSSMAYNLNRKNKNLAFYEFGKTYGQNGDSYYEQQRLQLAVTGSSTRKNWTTREEIADFYFVKGVISAMAGQLGISAKQMTKLAKIEGVSANKLKAFDVKQSVWSCSIDMDKLHGIYVSARFELAEIPIYPVVVRDVSAVVDISVDFKEIEKIVHASCGAYFRDLEVFDVFKGEKLGEGKKAYAFSVYLYDEEKTMTDELTESLLEKLIANLETKVGALIRKK